MQPKLYVTNYPAGDFRAMPALGGGHALLKWVTSFPGQSRARPADRERRRDPLERRDRRRRGGHGRGLGDRAAHGRGGGAGGGDARVARRGGGRGRRRRERTRSRAQPEGARPGRRCSGTSTASAHTPSPPTSASASPRAARRRSAADVVVTVTPGKQILLPEGSLRPGQHVSLMGADGPGKAEIAVEEIRRASIFCDEWEQASHGGELAAAVEAGAIGAGRRDGARRRPARARRRDGVAASEITIFDSTGSRSRISRSRSPPTSARASSTCRRSTSS